MKTIALLAVLVAVSVACERHANLLKEDTPRVVGLAAFPVLCPVTGEKVTPSPNASQLVYNNSQTIYFCCNDCFADFVKKTLDYLDNGASIPPVYIGSWARCPVTGELIAVSENTSHLTFNWGQTLFFCCDDCVKLFVQNPDMYIQQTY